MDAVAQVQVRGPVRPSARRVPLVPREHGASFMSAHALLLGLVVGVAAGRVDATGLGLSLAIGLLFLPFSAAVSVLSLAALRARARRRAAALAAAETVLGALALVHGPTSELLVLGAVAFAIGVAYALARTRGGPRAVATQLVAIAGISLLAPTTWLLAAGDAGPWPLSAVAAFLAFGGTVPYVRERVHRRRLAAPSAGERLRRGWVAIAWQVLSLAAAIVGWLGGAVAGPVPLAFLPGLAKTAVGIATPESRPPIKRIGYVETAVSTAFAVLVGIGFARTA